VIYPPRVATYEAHRNTLIGNTCLYGATAANSTRGHGRRALRRAQLRRAGVVEGIGDHGCEYMTGGTVIVLGDTGLTSAPA